MYTKYKTSLLVTVVGKFLIHNTCLTLLPVELEMSIMTSPLQDSAATTTSIRYSVGILKPSCHNGRKEERLRRDAGVVTGAHLLTPKLGQILWCSQDYILPFQRFKVGWKETLRKGLFLFLCFWMISLSFSLLRVSFLPFTRWRGCGGEVWHVEWDAPRMSRSIAFLGACFHERLSVSIRKVGVVWWLILSLWHGLIGTRVYELVESPPRTVSCLFFLNHPYLVMELLSGWFSLWHDQTIQTTFTWWWGSSQGILSLVGAWSDSLGFVGCNSSLTY